MCAAENENWECFLLLLTIIDYIFAPVISALYSTAYKRAS